MSVTNQTVATFDFHYLHMKRENLDNGRLSIKPLSSEKSTLRRCSNSCALFTECAWFTESGAWFLLNHTCQHPTPNNSTLFGHLGLGLGIFWRGAGNTNHKV